jgi:succinate-semialdehyde dehydrogenase/glutarate-semialdehyde dehydrogenase
MIFQSKNPWSGEVLAEFESFSDDLVGKKLRLAEEAFLHWSGSGLPFRLERMAKLIQILNRDAEILAFSMSEEMGKPLLESRAEVTKSISLIELFFEKAEGWLEEIPVKTVRRTAVIRPEALGGVLLVMPWNFPLWQVLRAAIPALCAGNVILLKHAPNVFRFSNKLESIFLEAGFPEGVFQDFHVGVPQLESMIAHDAVAGVSFTGSESAGRSLASLAGKYLKKSVLELGGSDPFIVLKDADVNRAAQMAASSRMINNGQSCIAAKRFLIHESLYDAFSSKFIEALAQFKPGNPCLESTRLGPLARLDLVENLQRQMDESMDKGAEILYAMKADFPAESPFFLPVLLGNVRPGMPVFDEETFGPIACISSFQSEEEVIRLANQTRYGLGASIHSADEPLARKMALQLQCGTVAINSLMRSDPALPFGGMKASGFGKEMAKEGMMEFCNLKVIMQD